MSLSRRFPPTRGLVDEAVDAVGPRRCGMRPFAVGAGIRVAAAVSDPRHVDEPDAARWRLRAGALGGGGHVVAARPDRDVSQSETPRTHRRETDRWDLRRSRSNDPRR